MEAGLLRGRAGRISAVAELTLPFKEELPLLWQFFFSVFVRRVLEDGQISYGPMSGVDLCSCPWYIQSVSNKTLFQKGGPAHGPGSL